MNKFKSTLSIQSALENFRNSKTGGDRLKEIIKTIMGITA